MNNIKVNNISLINSPANGDVGYDIFANSEPNIVGNRSESSGYTHIDYIEYDSGLIIDPGSEFHTLLFPRSSISNKNLILCNSVGVIDSSYRGSVKVRFKYIASPEDINNLGRFSASHTVFVNPDSIYKKGDKIAQLVFQKSIFAQLEQCDSFSETSRGQGGFGSTDHE
jgi:dUTP pyrophosphatase